MNGPSLHLSWAEMACKDQAGTPYPLDWRNDPLRAIALARSFEDVRAECCIELGADCPIVPLEVYRTLIYQAYLRTIPQYKAALKSQHCEGKAIDGACPRLLTFDQFASSVKRASARKDSPIRYIEYRPRYNYIHWDVRSASKLFEETID